MLSSPIPAQSNDNLVHLLDPCSVEVHLFSRDRNYTIFFQHFIVPIDFFASFYRLSHAAAYAHCLSLLTPLSRHGSTE